MNISTLNLEWRHRPSGNLKSNRKYLDFIVDGQTLYSMLPDKHLDLISCLGWGVVSANNDAVRRLILDLPADLEGNRRSLYVCPECGDLGCGAITAVIEQDNNHIVWHDFGFEYGYDPSGCGIFVDVAPIYFERERYKQTIMSALINE